MARLGTERWRDMHDDKRQREKKRKTKEEEQVHFSGKGIEGSGAHVRRIQDYA